MSNFITARLLLSVVYCSMLSVPAAVGADDSSTRMFRAGAAAIDITPAKFPVIVLFAIIGEDSKQPIPPPRPALPLLAVFPVMMLFLIVGEDWVQ